MYSIGETAFIIVSFDAPDNGDIGIFLIKIIYGLTSSGIGFNIQH